jgi:hypothetical protein
MTETQEAFVREVAGVACKQLLGQLDRESRPSVVVTDTVVVTQDDGALALEVTYVSEGVEHHLGWPLDVVDDFIADAVITSVEYLTSLIRIEIRERVDTREF